MQAICAPRIRYRLGLLSRVRPIQASLPPPAQTPDAFVRRCAKWHLVQAPSFGINWQIHCGHQPMKAASSHPLPLKIVLVLFITNGMAALAPLGIDLLVRRSCCNLTYLASAIFGLYIGPGLWAFSFYWLVCSWLSLLGCVVFAPKFEAGNVTVFMLKPLS